MPRKLTLEEAREIVKDKGYTLISEIYKGYYKQLIIEDSEGYRFYFSLSKLSNRKPTRFHNQNPYSIYNIKLWCKLNNKPFKLLSEKYTSKESLIWKCLKEDCGEIFEAKWGNIFSCNAGCSYCSGHRVGISNCLVTKNPDLAKEWHPTLNGDLTPWDVTCGYDKNVWWLCEQNHEWEANIYNRNHHKSGCPFCAGQRATNEHNLLISNPKLASEWNYEKNDKLPEDYCPSSGNKVWWRCENGHEWESQISNRNNGKNCPYCSGYYASEDYNLLVCFPDICKDWDYNKNDKLPDEYTPHAHFYVWWKCNKCGHEWYGKICNRTSHNTGCPQCNNSRGENEVNRILNEYDIYSIFHHIFHDCKYKNSLEFDFYLPNNIVAIEYQGIQHYEPVDFAGKGEVWAIEQFKLNQIKDQIKRYYCKKNNIKLIEIPYWDFDNIEEILIRELMINNEQVI